MSFLANLFSNEKKRESVVLIDIGTVSVAGAYIEHIDGELPVVHYTRRLPIEIRGAEPHEDAMLRALGVLGDALIREGAPLLLRATGSATVDMILVSVDAPWQTTSVRTEHFEQNEPFTFSRSMVMAALKKTGTAPEGKLLVDESIIGTILNGYETHSPYGKRVKRASLVILTSLIDEHVAEKIKSTLRGLYHTKHIFSIASSSLRYQAMRIAFPHERDALILDATGPLTSIALVRRNLLVDVTEVPTRTNNTEEWLKKISGELAALALRFPLPRTIFLLAREEDSASLRKALDVANLGKLWLSDNPPKIISVLGNHIVSLVKQATTATPDLSLLLMALYSEHRRPE